VKPRREGPIRAVDAHGLRFQALFAWQFSGCQSGAGVSHVVVIPCHGIHKGPKVGKIFARNYDLRAKKPPQRGSQDLRGGRPSDRVYIQAEGTQPTLPIRVFGLTRHPAVPGPPGGGSTFLSCQTYALRRLSIKLKSQSVVARKIERVLPNKHVGAARLVDPTLNRSIKLVGLREGRMRHPLGHFRHVLFP
jgi:hypothetical protein